MKSWLRATVVLALLAVPIGSGALYTIGSELIRATPYVIGPAPADLCAETLTFPSESGTTVAAWLIRGEPGAGVVLLLHGAYASRLAMVDRARFLAREQFGVMLIDFQAHGESPGENITLGFLESRDVRAALDALRDKLPNERIGIIGVSLGAAAAVLGDQPLTVDAVVLEAMYPTLDEAVDDRMRMRLGRLGPVLSPLLTWQVWPRLGVSCTQLRPIWRVDELHMPKFFIAGSDDRHTLIEESRAIFAAAAPPKSLWVVDGASHVDFHKFDPSEYEARVGAFFVTHLRAR